MAEAFVIIIALGGLEFVLWCLGRKPQKRQIELLHSIWAGTGSEEIRGRATPGRRTHQWRQTAGAYPPIPPYGLDRAGADCHTPRCAARVLPDLFRSRGIL